MTGLVGELRRQAGRFRGLLAAVLAGVAALTGLATLRPAPPPTETVLAAAHDLAAGAPLGAEDLTSLALPPATVPVGALRPGAAVIGRLVAGPVRRGEPLTDVRLVGPSLLAALDPRAGSELVAVPVRIADAGSVALLHAGDRVDVLAAADVTAARDPALAAENSPGANAAGAASVGAAHRVAVDVLVVTVPDTKDSGGALVVLATTSAVAQDLAGAAVRAQLSLVLRA